MATLTIFFRSTLLLAVIASSTAHVVGRTAKDTVSYLNEESQLIPYDCMDHLSPDHFTESKNGIVREDYRWPRGVIPIVYHSTVSEEHKKIIKDGIALIEDRTCLKVVDKTDEVVFVTIRTDLGNSCYCTGIGMRGTSNQTINLGPEGCMYPGTAAHEILHAAGLWHEHARPDRDTYIELIKSNISPAQLSQFALCTDNPRHEACSTFGVPYDVRSIMHYAAINAFGINQREPVMRSKPGYPAIPKSQREYTSLTENDVTKLHIMYDNCQ